MACPLDMVTLTVIMKSRDVDHDLAPSRDREHSRFAGFVSNDESSVLGAVLRNIRYLGSSPIRNYSGPEVCVAATYGREHPQDFV